MIVIFLVIIKSPLSRLPVDVGQIDRTTLNIVFSFLDSRCSRDSSYALWLQLCLNFHIRKRISIG